MEAADKPSTVSASAWDAIWSNFNAAAGATVGTYQTYLDTLDTYLGNLGEATADVSQLYSYALQLADAAVVGQTLTSSQDAAFPTPGLSLSFVRSFPLAISERYQLGPLGFGWSDNWNITASTNSQGNVTINDGGAIRFFTLEANGNYDPSVGDNGTLALVAGAYQLREADGTLTAFNANGTLNYMQDAHGNRITASYANGQLTGLTDSSGAALTLTYNAQGRISSVSDSAGRTTTFTYDATGQYLMSATGPGGTTQYGYLTGQSAAQQNALTSITNPDATQLSYSYDAQGRLTGEQHSGGADPTTFTYGIAGTVTTTDATRGRPRPSSMTRWIGRPRSWTPWATSLATSTTTSGTSNSKRYYPMAP